MVKVFVSHIKSETRQFSFPQDSDLPVISTFGNFAYVNFFFFFQIYKTARMRPENVQLKQTKFTNRCFDLLKSIPDALLKLKKIIKILLKQKY